MPTVNTTTLTNDTLNLMNQVQNSPIGQLLSQQGDGGSLVITTAQHIAKLLYEAACDICRTAWALPSSSTITPPASSTIVPFSSMVTASFGNLWFVRNVVYNGTALQRVTQKYYDAASLWGLNASVANPTYFSPLGAEGIGVIGPFPSSPPSSSLAINGFALPPFMDPANPTVAITWLDYDLCKYMAYYAAAILALENSEDSSLNVRYEPWKNEYMQGKQEMLARSFALDPTTAQIIFGQQSSPQKTGRPGSST